jgi:MerR family mercuric resistance operon transcriptional regulator
MHGIGSVSQQTGCKIETIRYYESIGLLEDPGRTEGGHRTYNVQHIQRLKFIRRSRQLGFSLHETGELLELAMNSEKTCSQVRDVTLAHLADVRGKIRDLLQMESVLDDMVSECDTNTSPCCPIIESLSS